MPTRYHRRRSPSRSPSPVYVRPPVRASDVVLTPADVAEPIPSILPLSMPTSAECTVQAPAKPAPLSSPLPSSSLHRSPECDFTKVIVARAVVVTRESLIDRYTAYDLFLATRNNPDPSA